MQIGITVDNTIPLHLPTFVEFFRVHSTTLRCRAIDFVPRFSSSEINFEEEINKLNRVAPQKFTADDVSLLVTAIPFDNNYFYIGNEKVYIVSLSGWHLLTTLPMSNGLAYLICQIILSYQMDIGITHENPTGCINDFLWDKTGIDVCMRAAFICDRCREESERNPWLQSPEFKDLESILNAISMASRKGIDILSEVPAATGSTVMPSAPTDVFLCHNSQDKPAVRTLNEALQNAGIRTWLDEQKVEPGEIWQDKLEAAITSVATCLVIVGDSGQGPWQDIERRTFISEFANRGCKIIPVLIGNPARPPELPLFLKQFMWADLRGDDGRNLARLIAALRS